MFFRRIVFSSLCVGVITGGVYGIFQFTRIAPIMQAAEQYEVAPDIAVSNEHRWTRYDEAQRSLYSMASNILIGTALSMLLMALMAVHNLKTSKPKVKLLSGIGWGVAGLLALFVAPALLGMHPEIPGARTAALTSRQLWWLFGVLATALGIAVIYYAPSKFKFGGVLIAGLPHLAGAPERAEPRFFNDAPQAVAALTALSNDFYLMTAIGAVIFFLLLGALSGYASNRLINIQPV